MFKMFFSSPAYNCLEYWTHYVIFLHPQTSTKQYIWKQNKTSILSSFSPPARWRFLDFNKGATPSSSSSPSSPSSPLLPRRLWMQWSAARPECHAARSGCLDPTAISRAQEAVERAWTRTTEWQNIRQIQCQKECQIECQNIFAINTSRWYVVNYVRTYSA